MKKKINENLATLLNEKSIIKKKLLLILPSNSEIFNAITGQNYEPASNEVVRNKDNELCIMKWLVSSNEYQLCIGYIKQKVENGFFIDHLHWVVKKRNTQWAYPSTEDIQIAEKEQVLHCKLKGEWNLNDLRNIKYVSRNSGQISAVFNEQ